MGKAFTFGDLQKAYEPATEKCELEKGLTVTCRELSGAERFDFAKFANPQEWETYRWLAFKGIADPRPNSIDELDTIKPEWVIEIAKVVMGLSGITPEAEEEAEKKSVGISATGSSSLVTSDAA